MNNRRLEIKRILLNKTVLVKSFPTRIRREQKLKSVFIWMWLAYEKDFTM